MRVMMTNRNHTGRVEKQKSSCVHIDGSGKKKNAGKAESQFLFRGIATHCMGLIKERKFDILRSASTGK